MSVETLKPWPVNGYAPGGYTCVCLKCSLPFDGDKRAIHCLDCAVATLTATNAELREQVERLKGDIRSYEKTMDAIAIVDAEAAERAAVKVKPLDGKYGEVLIPFLALMERELHANSGKGDRPGWLEMDRKTALLEIFYHLAKLQKATKDDDQAGIREYGADVANMAMMLVDICGALPLSTLSPAESEPEQEAAQTAILYSAEIGIADDKPKIIGRLPLSAFTRPPSEQAVTEAGLEAAARLITEWLGFAWDGLSDGRVTERGFPVFTHGQFGWGFQGRKGDMTDLARAAITAAMEAKR